MAINPEAVASIATEIVETANRLITEIAQEELSWEVSDKDLKLFETLASGNKVTIKVDVLERTLILGSGMIHFTIGQEKKDG